MVINLRNFGFKTTRVLCNNEVYDQDCHALGNISNELQKPLLSRITKIKSKSGKGKSVKSKLIEVRELKKCYKQRRSFSNDFLPVNVVDIDKNDVGKIIFASEYVNDIYGYMFELERRYSVQQNYMKGSVITSRMREMLVDWIVCTHLQFLLLPETLFLSVAILDRYLQNNVIDQANLQLVAITSLLIACKYEETCIPKLDDLLSLTPSPFNRSEIVDMEIKILKALDYSLGGPLPIHFLRRFFKAASVNADNFLLGQYFMELCLKEYSLCHVPPSLIAAGACSLLLQLITGQAGLVWSKTLQHYSTYAPQDVRPIERQVARLVLQSHRAVAKNIVTRKYGCSVFMEVSSLAELGGEVVEKIATHQYVG